MEWFHLALDIQGHHDFYPPKPIPIKHHSPQEVLLMEEIRLTSWYGKCSLSVYPIIYNGVIHPRWWSPDFSRIVTGFSPSALPERQMKILIPCWMWCSNTPLRHGQSYRTVRIGVKGTPQKVVEISGDVNKGGSVIPPSIGVWMYIGTWGGPGWVRDCNYTLVSWFMTHLFRGRKQPTYKGVRIQSLSTMDIPVGGDFFFGFSPRNFGKWSMFDKHIFQIGCNHEVAKSIELDLF